MKTVVYFAALILQLLTSSALQFSPFNEPYLWHGGNFIYVRLIPELDKQDDTQSSISVIPDYQDVIRSQSYTGSYSQPFYDYGSQRYTGSHWRPYYGYGSQPYSEIYSLPLHIRLLVEKIVYLRREVLNLEREKAKCNPLAPAEGSKVLGSLCYTIRTTLSSYPDALTYCRSIGGTLAEPYQQFSHVLYEDLEHEFPLQFNLIQSLEHDQLWIGPHAGSGSNDFKWPSTGTNLVPQPTFVPSLVTPAPSFERGALMTFEGKKWKAADKMETHPFVCWSTPV